MLQDQTMLLWTWALGNLHPLWTVHQRWLFTWSQQSHISPVRILQINKPTPPLTLTWAYSELISISSLTKLVKLGEWALAHISKYTGLAKALVTQSQELTTNMPGFAKSVDALLQDQQKIKYCFYLHPWKYTEKLNSPWMTRIGSTAKKSGGGQGETKMYQK